MGGSYCHVHVDSDCNIILQFNQAFRMPHEDHPDKSPGSLASVLIATISKK